MIKSVTVYRMNSDGSYATKGVPPLKLTLTNPEGSYGYAVLGIDGMGPGMANLNSTEWSTIDGAHTDSIHIPKRSIVLKLQFIDMFENGRYVPIETIRTNSYKFFPRKKPVRLEFEMDNGLYFIDGIVEGNEPDIFQSAETADITIHCADPYFYNTKVIKGSLSTVEDMFHFEFGIEETPGVPVGKIKTVFSKEIINNSDVDIGIKIRLGATGPVNNLVAYNETNGTHMSFSTANMTSGQWLYIDTREGHKSITNSAGENKINLLDLYSDWLTLEPGENTLGFNAESGYENLLIDYEYQERHDGI